MVMGMRKLVISNDYLRYSLVPLERVSSTRFINFTLGFINRIDGPDDLAKINKYTTLDGRAICKDVVNYINKNVYPKLIAFDGRISSIVYSSTYLLNYRFFPGIRYSIKFNSIKGKILLNRHSYFLYK